MSKIQVVLADDHDIVRNGIKQLLDNESDIDVIGEAANGQEALDVVAQLKPDVLVMDVSMPVMTGIEAVKVLKERGDETKVLILSMFDVEDYVLEAVRNGASGYVLKDANKMKFLEAIRTVNAGKRYYGHDVSNFIVDHFLNNSEVGQPQRPVKALDIDLSSREIAILSQISNGRSNKEIADDLGISVRTVESHRLNMMKKMSANNVAELVRVALEAGVI